SFDGEDELPSKTNYFIGNDQSKWQSNIPNYQAILAENVYPGINLKYYGTNSQLEHDFIVAPGTDPSQIAFSFEGQNELTLDGNGNLVLKAGDDQLTMQAPVSYQDTDHGRRNAVTSSFNVAEDKTVRIALGNYDLTKPLVIDPVLIYSTYLGGSGSERGVGITVDASDNVYVMGFTGSTNFPTASPFQAASGGGTDVFVSKFNPTGSALVYSTYLGGSGADSGNGVVVDLSGAAYLTGETTSTNFPTSSPFQAANAGGTDTFVTKLNAAGSALTYSTYLGGTAFDKAFGIALDSSNNAYLAGTTNSSNFPTSSPFQATPGGAGDVYVTKFNAAGSALTYSTYLGGSAFDTAYDLTVDTSGSAYITGYTLSGNFPTSSPFQAASGGAEDTFVTKFNAAGSALTYSTYLGGSGLESGEGVDVDSSGNAYIVGQTGSSNFPTSSPFQAANAGGIDNYVTKLNAAGSALTYSTYLGGSGTDYGLGVAVDTTGNAYTTGLTDSTNFPTSSAYQTSNGGSDDAFVTKLNAAGSALTYSTYLGGSASDFGMHVALSLDFDVYVAGQTSSTNFPTTSAFQSSNGGSSDAFVTLLTEHSVILSAQVNPTLTFTVNSTSCPLGTLSVTQTQFCTYTITAATNGTSGYTISYLAATTLTSPATDTISHLSSQTASSLGSEQFGFNLRANTAAGSNTSVDFGADASGGAGTVAANYNTINQFKLNTSGETIASATGPSVATIFTVGTIANIASSTEAGAYTTTLTYNIVSGY
ncbi:MAG: SBBP repeat-containing protein, partial [Patescibacteria group bacterium]